MAWHDDENNGAILGDLRQAVDDNGRVLVFLGAGVSFGAARFGSRARFEATRWRDTPLASGSGEKNAEKGELGKRDKGAQSKKFIGKGKEDRKRKKGGPDKGRNDGSSGGGAPPVTARLLAYEDGEPMPSWTMLMSRMRRELSLVRPPEQQRELDQFFEDQDYLDCAQLFRSYVGEAFYFQFLNRQFAPPGGCDFTPSHEELVRLDLPVLFTTNYDSLIEDAHLAAGIKLEVSADEQGFKAAKLNKPAKMLVKLHGTIDRHESIVLTRDDYARSRVARREMFASLRNDLTDTSFLFIGFSLSDPNVNIILDDVRVALDGRVPLSYTVQAGRNWTKEQYLQSMGIRTVWIDDWGQLPGVLQRINPRVPAT